ncbi:MAG: hypothetical protein M1834_007153 [Cirrosporium novae-zelandiae]|nr:MAG: hypothetical protein M1834_007153 [Cirrosporium novae-zelandiae]
MLLRFLPILCLLVLQGYAAVKDTDESTTVLSGTSIANDGGDLVPTSGVTYLSYTSTITLTNTKKTKTKTKKKTTTTTGSTSDDFSSMAAANSSTTTTKKKTTTTPSVTVLSGHHKTTSTSTAHNGTMTTNNGTSTTTSTTTTPLNTQPCNNYPEFCIRKYSNITEVGTHNSPFVRASNAAANQELDVTTQLDDGIRMLQGQTHLVNGTVYFCHTSCDILNAGTAESYFTKVASWVATHPYDVVTLLIANGGYIKVTNFTQPLIDSGLEKYAYTPPKIPMGIDDWPILSELILNGRRVVIFMDYQANQTEVPYILDEFSQVWETPFDPTNRSFPCTVQRPPKIKEKGAKERMYLMNHNLNTDITIAGIEILVPNLVEMNITNNVTGYGSLGVSTNNCVDDWSVPPNFLLVDYYNIGDGSVFEVAAQHNNVTYTSKCCGLAQSAAIRLVKSNVLGTAAWALALMVVLA